MTRALVVDDEPSICQCFETLFAELDCDVTAAASAEVGLDLIDRGSFDVIVMDVRLPGMDGLTALSQIRDRTDVPVIVMTAHGSLSTAVSAVRAGAFEYLPKPIDLDHVTGVLRRAIAESTARPQAPIETDSAARSEELVGDSLVMQHLFRRVALAAQHDAPVLITGESGTGKEMVARAIHHHSQRADSAIVPVHLASLSESLLERELYGHTAGAFTGAQSSQTGVIAQADGGTLFLDEIGETPLAVQVKLLRTIETQEYYPVGSATGRRSDFRLIAATNRPADYLQNSDQFRTDFFYRLATIQIDVPPLRQHREDIPALANHFLHQCSDGVSRTFSEDAIQELMRRPYPGNVRELRNVVVSAATETTERVIGPEALTSAVTSVNEERTEASADAELRRSARRWAEHALTSQIDAPLPSAAEIVESELISAAMEHAGGKRSAAAQLLGIHRETLRERLARYSRDSS